MKKAHIFHSLLITACVACGENGEYKSSSLNEELEPLNDGTYHTILRPVNFHSNGFIPYGTATFRVSGDDFQVSTALDDDQPVSHRQSVHFGSRCPDLNDDRNGDGFVDYQEALAVVGDVLLPLDNDVNSQMAGAGKYPRGAGMTYNRSASVSRISADLWGPDENGHDEFAKLAPGSAMGLKSRVVLVHGTSNDSLPASVAARAGETAALSLPIVCGVLRKVK